MNPSAIRQVLPPQMDKRVFEPNEPTGDDLRRANELAAEDCPRRYCWWWQTLSFDWDVPVAQGCTFLKAIKPAGWRNIDVPCIRAQSSECDHYEPREPHLIEDGFETDRFKMRKG